MAPPAERTWAWRLPGRRHGSGQDDPGPVAVADREAEESRVQAEPVGRSGIAAGQLGGGDRALRPRAEREDRASLGDDGRRPQSDDGGGTVWPGPGDHKLRLTAAPA